MDLISVIIPVYNVEKYLNQCIKSVINQTYYNLEIFLVEDGSKDKSGQICDEWAKRDKRIKVIHKENGGAGHSRNIALDIAKGEYVSLIDSDDYIEPHMYEHLISLMDKGIDIAECGILPVYNDEGKLDSGITYDIKVCSSEEAIRLHILDKMFCQTPPNKLYRRTTIGDIRFPVGNCIDDEFWTYQVIANANKLVRSSCNMYAYRQQEGSVMHRSFSLARLQAIDAKRQRLELIKRRFPELIAVAKINLWYTCLYQGQMSLIYLNKKDRKQAFSMINEVITSQQVYSLENMNLDLKQRVWWMLSKVSIKGTCRLRNLLKIGI